MLRLVSKIVVACALGLTGCATPIVQDPDELAETVASEGHPLANKAAARKDTLPQVAATDQKPSSSPAEQADQELIEMLAELRSTGAIDADSQQRIIKDWHAANPALRPQLLEMFRTTLAYRKDNAKRDYEQQSQHQQDSVNVNQAVERNGPGNMDVRRTIRQPAASLPAPEIQSEQQTVSPNSASTNLVAQPAVAVKSDNEKVLFQSASPTYPGTLVESPWPPAAASTRSASQVAKTSPEALSLPSGPAPRQSTENRTVAEPITPSPEPLSWEEHLSSAITGLESQLSDEPSSAADVSRHAGLRLLYLLDGRRSDALRAIEGLPATQQDFWSEQLYGLATYMDAERNTDANRRTAEASHHFREALARLNNMATLEVKNLTLCTDVKSYGVYEPFAKNVFKPGQEVLIYAEVENFLSEPVDKDYKISLRTSYQILDPHAARVAKQEFPTVVSQCKAMRRDLFVSYSIFLPQRIYPGKYTLQFNVEDLQSQKLGNSTLDFEVAEK